MTNNINLPSIKKLATDLAIKYNKSLGQHFIFDLDITAKIVSFAGSLTDKTIVEIGPGLGSLTRPILDAGANCIALEKDEFFAEQLNYIKQRYPKLDIINIDALDFEFEKLSKELGVKLYIIANLPYNISSQILYKFFSCFDSIEKMVLMFQKEVAIRITAKSGTKDYGKSSVLAGYLFKTEQVMELPPEVFTPAPKVFSQVVTFVPRKDISITTYNQLNKLLTVSFKAKRKMLKNNLCSYFDKNIEEVLEQCNIPLKARPEDLEVNDYLALLRCI